MINSLHHQSTLSSWRYDEYSAMTPPPPPLISKEDRQRANQFLAVETNKLPSIPLISHYLDRCEHMPILRCNPNFPQEYNPTVCAVYCRLPPTNHSPPTLFAASPHHLPAISTCFPVSVHAEHFFHNHVDPAIQHVRKDAVRRS